MVKETPSLGRIVGMIAFTASCIGILMYLWITFGGSIPLRAEGYRVKVQFPEATQLAQEADVRISGVNVGRVKVKVPDRETGLTEATLEIQARYAPIALDSNAVLRQKTLLGETYVELSPGTRDAEKLADGGTLAAGQVAKTVELDEIFRTFDPKTRRAFGTWLDQQGRAVEDGGKALNDALATLTPFAEDVDNVLRVLDSQEEATKGLVRDTGVVFGALTERQGQLRNLIEGSNRVFRTTAARDRELADTFVAFPTFLRETRTTTRRLTDFALKADPLVDQLRPAARELSPTLVDVKALAPDLRGLFRDLDPLIEVSRPGLTALERTLKDTRPFLARLDPYLRDLQPAFDYLGLYRREIAAFFANSTAATGATEISDATGKVLNYLRTTNPLNPEILAAYPDRLATNRANAYTEPGGFEQLGRGLPVYGGFQCENAPPAPRLRPDDPILEEDYRRLTEEFVFSEENGKAPPCREQAPLGRVVDQDGRYPQLRPLSAP